jgi:tetratricopeptide (TPR) repeat protein
MNPTVDGRRSGNGAAPGADGRLARALEEYRGLLEAGAAPDRAAFLARYPEMAEELAECLSGLEFVHAVAPSLSRDAAQGVAAAEVGAGVGPGAPLGDFRIIREVGRGGMGVVYEAEQISLGRRVALKVLPFAATMDPRQLQRFHNEARAAAGLHHTNIVPVHAVGQERGVHYYAMQFIDGRTLAEFIAQQRPDAAAPAEAVAPEATVPPAAQATSAAPRDAAYFRRVAEWGIQAAEALDHAHQQGVFHRDIKPANLLVDVQRNLWVTDFGLAQIQSDARLTRSSELVGTLRYMSPEQALAKRAVVDHRTDIYSLGATLYELLTLRPVFTGSDRQELLRQIAFEEPAAPRSLNGAIPTELETIVLKALEKDPAERYSTAKELADDLRCFLNDEPIRWARRPPWPKVALKWARRHRLAVGAALCLMLTLTVLAGTAGWVGLWLQQRHAEEARQAEALRRDVGAALTQAIRFRQGAHFQESRELLEQAQQRLGTDGPSDLLAEVDQVLADTELARRLDAARQRSFAEVKGGKADFAGAAKEYAAALKEVGLGQEGDDPEVVAARVRASGVRAEVIAALDDWAGIAGDVPQRAWLLAVARAADPDPERDALRQPELWRNKAALAKAAGEARVLELSPQLVVALGRALFTSGGDVVPLLRKAHAHRPHDFWLNWVLATALRKAKHRDEAIGYYLAALALRPEAAVQNNLGVALDENGQPDEAIPHYEQALRIDPENAWAHTSLGAALADMGRVDEAIGHFEKALKSHPELVAAHNNLALALRTKGRPDEAIAHYRRALSYEPQDGITHSNLGIALCEQGLLDEALNHCEQALSGHPEPAVAHSKLGFVLRTMGRVDDAVKHYEQALLLDPKCSMAHNNLGNILRGKGQLDKAISHFEQAVRSDARDAGALTNLGTALCEIGQLDEGFRSCKEAVEFGPKNTEALYNLGILLHGKERLDEAVEYYQRALDVNHNYAEAKGALGRTLLDLGRFDEAQEVTRSCLHLLPPRSPMAARAVQQLQRCERILALKPRLPDVLRGKDMPTRATEWLEFAWMAQATKQYADSERLYRNAFAADPRQADDLLSAHRYHAACCTVSAAAALKPNDMEQPHLRRQALDWLGADLALWKKQTEIGSAPSRAIGQRALWAWQNNPGLASVRDKERLAVLPDAERKDWEKLWADVEALRKQMREAK